MYKPRFVVWAGVPPLGVCVCVCAPLGVGGLWACAPVGCVGGALACAPVGCMGLCPRSMCGSGDRCVGKNGTRRGVLVAKTGN